MNFSVNPKLFNDFDDVNIGVSVVQNADNSSLPSSFYQKLDEVLKEVTENRSSEKLSLEPKIASWRDAHRKFGSKPKDYPSSVEALYKRILKGQGLGRINPLVDIYNYISLKYMLPAGGEDLDQIKGNLELTYAANNEKPVKVLGKDDLQAPPLGEVIYKDDDGTICRRWNWREVKRTILTPKTKACILVIEGIHPVTVDEIKKAQNELSELVTNLCKATVNNHLIDKNQPSVSI